MQYFAFCIHNHQPVGNFDHVLEDAFKNAYWPFLERLSRFPSIKLTLHTSGFLLDWIAERHPEYIGLLRTMVARGQVEPMGGGYYEPILAVIPERDRLCQISLLSDRIEELLGKRPKGLWLAERVWEPTLPSTLKKAGIDYIIVDDFHFIKSGLDRSDLGGYYITEDQGSTIKVFPGSERLRYLIPFKPLDSLVEHLKSLKGFLAKGSGAFYGDDGEKFGVWPGTYKWLYDDGWLEGFLKTIEDNLGWLKPVTFGEYSETHGPVGRIYLPTTSYREMGEWALPAHASRSYAELVNDVRSWDRDERVVRFLQGGQWRNFFSKYPESNWMHKRMLQVSSAVAKAEDSGIGAEEARRRLLMAQCNDAYWHGIFGGLYLPHLRTSVYENLIKAEGMLGEGAFEPIRVYDIDSDAHDEMEMRGEDLNVFISPANGGSVVEMDFRPKAINPLNTLSRWREGYHHKVQSGAEALGGKTQSIHDIVLSKEAGLEKYLSFDDMRRSSFAERFVGANEDISSFVSGSLQDLSDFHSSPFDARVVDGRALLSRKGDVLGTEVLLSKEFSIASDNSLSVRYDLRADGGISEFHGRPVLFGVELNIILPCCNGPACLYRFGPGAPHPEDIGLGSTGEVVGVSSVSLVDTHTGVAFSIEAMPSLSEATEQVRLWRHPVYTVSISESGFEKIFQGSRLLFMLPATLGRSGSLGLGFTVRVEALG
jgi:alpha-amylase